MIYCLFSGRGNNTNGNKDVEQESTATLKEDEIPDFQIGDLMTFADIQNLLNLKRSSTAERIKEAGLKPWKFDNSPTYMYLRKDVIAMFKRGDD